jgi:hypothetical protein
MYPGWFVLLVMVSLVLAWVNTDVVLLVVTAGAVILWSLSSRKKR